MIQNEDKVRLSQLLNQIEKDLAKMSQLKSNGQEKVTNDIKLQLSPPPPNQKAQERMNREKGEKIQNRFNLTQESDSQLQDDGDDQNQEGIYNLQLYQISNKIPLNIEQRQSQLKIINQQEQSVLNSLNKKNSQNSHSSIQSLTNSQEFYNQGSSRSQSYLWNDPPIQHYKQKPQQKFLLFQSLSSNYFKNSNLKRCINQAYVLNKEKEQEKRIKGKNQQISKEKDSLSHMGEKNLKQYYVRGRGGKKRQYKVQRQGEAVEGEAVEGEAAEVKRVRYNLVTKRQLWMKGKGLFQKYSNSRIKSQRNIINKFKKSKALNQTLLKELSRIQEIHEFLINQIYTEGKRSQIAGNIINCSGKSRQIYQQQKVKSRLQKFDFIRQGLKTKKWIDFRLYKKQQKLKDL